MFKAFLKDETGATAIEYGLLAALISLALIVGGSKIGTALGDTHNTVADRISRV